MRISDWSSDVCSSDLQWCAIPLSDGTHRLTRVSGLMLLAEIDVASRACMGWTVIVDEAYSQFDFLRTIKHALMPWRPKDMTGRRMQYLPNAWMPSAMEGDRKSTRLNSSH